MKYKSGACASRGKDGERNNTNDTALPIMISSLVINRLASMHSSPNHVALPYRIIPSNIHSLRRGLMNLKHSERPHTGQTHLTLLGILHLNLRPMGGSYCRLAVPRLGIAARPIGKSTAPRRSRLIHCASAIVCVRALVFGTVFPLPRGM